MSTTHPPLPESVIDEVRAAAVRLGHAMTTPYGLADVALEVALLGAMPSRHQAFLDCDALTVNDRSLAEGEHVTHCVTRDDGETDADLATRMLDVLRPLTESER